MSLEAIAEHSYSVHLNTLYILMIGVWLFRGSWVEANRTPADDANGLAQLFRQPAPSIIYHSRNCIALNRDRSVSRKSQGILADHSNC